jgi:glucokinase-like ROK family protein
MSKPSVDHAVMRDMNLSLVLNTLHNRAPLSRADLAAVTGLNKATVTSLVRELLAQGWIKELGLAPSISEVGRPAINLALNPEAGYFIGGEINVDFISIIITDFNVEIVSRRYETTSRLSKQEAVLERFLFLLQEAVDQVGRSDRPLFGIGVGVPGLVDGSSGKLLFAPNLGWRNVPLGDLLSERFAVPIFVSNEANLAALGESYFGAGRGSDWMLYVSFGVGIGGGIVANGRLMEGATGFAGEVGHMILERNGTLCNCGAHGCWETLAGQYALFDRIGRAIAEGHESRLSILTGDDMTCLTVPLIVEAAKAGDKVALKALYDTGLWMGIGIANLLNILNPQRVIVGGPLSEAHEFFLPIIRETVVRNAWQWVQKEAEIVTAEHRADAAIVGAVAGIYQRVLNQPRRWLQPTS